MTKRITVAKKVTTYQIHEAIFDNNIPDDEIIKWVRTGDSRFWNNCFNNYLDSESVETCTDNPELTIEVNRSEIIYPK